jgi:tRNA(fMet)-specific endonuclease VapC
VRIALDTTAYVAFKQNISTVVEYILKAERILFSPVVLAELMFGFRGGTKFTDNMAELNLFLDHPAVEFVRIGEVTADRYSRIAMELKRHGSPIPTNDIWIAAQAMEHGAELITLDSHFEKINGLVYTMF